MKEDVPRERPSTNATRGNDLGRSERRTSQRGSFEGGRLVGPRSGIWERLQCGRGVLKGLLMVCELDEEERREGREVSFDLF